MSKRSLCSAMLAAGLLMPVAQADTLWTFSYTGFLHWGEFDPDERFTGYFAGDDLDGDGVVEQGEISRFSFGSLDYNPAGFDYCGGGGYYCRVDDFSYHLDGRLSFRTDWHYTDEAARSYGGTVTGQRIEYGGYAGNGPSYSEYWAWTDQTRFAINPPPVPEPGRQAMLVAGLLAATVFGSSQRRLRRRRRHA